MLRSSSQDCIPYEVDNSVVHATPRCPAIGQYSQTSLPGSRTAHRRGSAPGLIRVPQRPAGHVRATASASTGATPRGIGTRVAPALVAIGLTSVVYELHYVHYPDARQLVLDAALRRSAFRVPQSAVIARSRPAPALHSSGGIVRRGERTGKDLSGNRQETGGLRPDCMRYTVRHVMSVTF